MAVPILFRQNEDVPPMQEICPWIDFLTDGLVLNKDGSLLAAFEYSGLDPEGSFDDEINAATEQLQRALTQFDSRITAWWVIDKRRDRSYPSNEFRNETAKVLDEIYSRPFVSGQHYSFTYSFFLLYTGNKGMDKIMDRASRIRVEEDVSSLAAFFKALGEGFSNRNAFAKDVTLLRENVDAFERIISSFVNAAPIHFKRLYYEEYCQRLLTILNRATENPSHIKPRGRMLDGWAPMEYLASGPDMIHFQGNTSSTYAAALNVIEWPESSTPKMMETLLSMDAELTLCQLVRFLNSPESTAEIQKAINYYNLTMYPVVGHALSKFTGKDPIPKEDKLILLENCTEALNTVNVSGLHYAYQNTFIMVYGKTQREMNRNADAVAQTMAYAKFGTIREGQNTLPTFCSMLPGQWAMQTRYELVSIENVADIAPIFTMDEGSRTHEFFSEEIYKRDVPAFAVFGNSYRGRVNFSPHFGQVGHMVIIAPTGGGKTTLINFLISQFQRYGDIQTFIFDRNYSCRIVTDLHDGTHIDLKNAKASFNPFFAMDDDTEEGRIWLREFIINRMLEGGFSPTADDRAEIDDAIRLLRNSDQTRRLSTFASLLPSHLEGELREWLEGGPYGMFDNEVDDFSLSSWTTVEMQHIMSVERIARAFMDYVFRKIFVSLDGRPTLIYLEEATFLLADPRFSDIIDGWLKTFRKLNAFLWLTIQSPTAITNASMASSMLDNIFTCMLLPNVSVEAHREAYKKNFGLADHQVDMIRSLQRRRDYLLVQNSESDISTRIMHATFPPEVLAFVRSEAHVLKLYNRVRDQHPDNWKVKYLEAVLNVPETEAEVEEVV